ncbi:hypothetical protein PILCRDRAFT_816820 [Piloderma croceum F 1598]|uniref:Uncharacterized protein n=1 Tax=Piloderma croceum (strain F 1598) TaxID=765440 RepID=A0A0C3C7H7_PILCF|nr:hypothetical protein PILCRDRAFT_816820 [Piloderma croceum F 1598]
MIGANLRSSSLKGQRSIADFFHILDHHIAVINADDYKLRQLDDEYRPLVGPPIERSFSGNIIAGSYLIEAAVERGEIMFKPIVTFFNCPFERTDSPSKPAAKSVDLGLATTLGHICVNCDNPARLLAPN